MTLFFLKKKLKPEEAKDVLADVLAEMFGVGGGIFKELFAEAISSKLGIKVPQEALDVLPIDISRQIAKAIASRFSDGVAYEVLKAMKKVLDGYRV